MSHYEQAAAAKEKDFKAIQKILDLDPEGLYRAVREYGITMCGFGPAVAMLVACKILGSDQSRTGQVCEFRRGERRLRPGRRVCRDRCYVIYYTPRNSRIQFPQILSIN